MFEKQAANKVAEQEEPSLGVKVDLRTEASNLPDKPHSAEENYLKRKAEVGQRDYEDFLRYQREKTRQDEARQAPRSIEAPERAPLHVDRRSFLTVVASTAAVGEAGVLAYTIKNDAPAQGLKHAGENYTEVQRHNIDRQLINPKADIGGRGFGDWVLLTPTKLGGGTYAVNLNTGRCRRVGEEPISTFRVPLSVSAVSSFVPV